MSNRKLIEEARSQAACVAPLSPDMEHLLRRLAAALEAMELPEGWVFDRCVRADGACVALANNGVWRAFGPGKYVIMPQDFSTAREAMATLDGK